MNEGERKKIISQKNSIIIKAMRIEYMKLPLHVPIEYAAISPLPPSPLPKTCQPPHSFTSQQLKNNLIAIAVVVSHGI
jgi:hypothetical protein